MVRSRSSLVAVLAVLALALAACGVDGGDAATGTDSARDVTTDGAARLMDEAPADAGDGRGALGFGREQAQVARALREVGRGCQPVAPPAHADLAAIDHDEREREEHEGEQGVHAPPPVVFGGLGCGGLQ